MVIGLQLFKEHFADYTGNYVIIGGTACDIALDSIGLKPRSTKDIDIILVVEALTPEFVKHFWEFIKVAQYERQEMSGGQRQYYRFKNPANEDYPWQLELFSRTPDTLQLDGAPRLTLIPVDDEEVSSLSAMLMDEDYYQYTCEHSIDEDGIRRADNIALICLKAKAFLNLSVEQEKGGQVDARNIKKHKTDVFRISVSLAAADRFEVPPVIKADLGEFVRRMNEELPGAEMFKDLGVRGVKAEDVLQQLKTTFNLAS